MPAGRGCSPRSSVGFREIPNQAPKGYLRKLTSRVKDTGGGAKGAEELT